MNIYHVSKSVAIWAQAVTKHLATLLYVLQVTKQTVIPKLAPKKKANHDQSDDTQCDYPDAEIPFPPVSSFVRELWNNRDQLRSLMKPRKYDVTKKPAGKVTKKPAGKAKKHGTKKAAMNKP